ncbi:MAG TPA: autotransporter-associated beta strand repeat-containing protein, partial [Verrucomicrobiae bacterium]
MRTILHSVSKKLVPATIVSSCLLTALTAAAANDTWNGGSSSSDNWSDASNWGGAAPAANDLLFFDGSARLTPNNDFVAGSIFGELNFNATAAAFNLGGNGIVLTNGFNAGNGLTSGGNITNLSGNVQAIGLPVNLSAGNHVIATVGGAGALNFSAALTRNPGAIAQFVVGGGSINLTGSGLTTVNDILGGWALIGVTANAGDWATLDGSGNVVAYTGYTGVTGAPTLPNSPGANVKWTATTGNAVIPAGVNDFNTLMFADNNTRVITNSGTLRLGAQGAIYMANGSTPSNNKGLTIGSVANQGVLTAGGGAGAGGEISFYDNSFVGLNNDLTINSVITDNSGFPVTVDIMGYCVLNGANTFSGGTYVNQGRCQSGSGTCFGTGPVYIFPGGEVSMAVAATWTNDFYVSGLGSTESAGLGAIRLAGRAVSGTIHLVGTSAIAGGGTITGKITGAGGLILGNGSVTGGSGKTTVGVAAAPNDYAGDTLVNNSTFATGVNTLGFNANANNVMPHGLGKGNVLINGGTGGSKGILDLSGTTQTINGLVSTGTVANIFVTNSTGSGVLIVGDNDTTALYKGPIMGAMALTKIGNGTQTLGGANTYSNATAINGGSLTLTVGASLPNTPQINVNSNGTFDVSAVCPFGLGVNQSLNVSNASISVSLVAATNAVTVSTLNVAGTTNFIHLTSIPNILSYPAQFTAIKYTSASGGLNFGLDPNLPVSSSTPYAGYVFYNTANNSVDVVLTAGPSAIKWSGYSGGAPNSSWDASTPNWKLFNGTATVYSDGLNVSFDDSASNSVVTLNQNVSPASIAVSNSTLAYTINGGNIITGTAS